MLNKMTRLTVCIAAVLTLGAGVIAQSIQNPRVAERLSFVAANAANAGPSGEGRMQIVINQWSPDAERDRLLTLLKTEGSDKVAQSLGRGCGSGQHQLAGSSPLHHPVRGSPASPGRW